MKAAKCEQVAQLTDSGFTETTNCGNAAVRHGVKIIEPIALDEQNDIIRKDGTVGTLTTDGSSPKHNNRVIEPNCRVRKLTPKECFRLMGVKDEDYEKIKQSDSSLYHLAGDSIVTTCLMALFAEMVDIKWEEKINYTEWFYGENKNERP